MNHSDAIEHTRQWVQSVVVGLNFCPFAKRELDKNRVRFVASHASKKKAVLQQCLDECQLLDSDATIETTLLVLPSGFADFFTYLRLLDEIEALLLDEGYEGIYQVASFHPEYCFADEDFDDPANFTNRSPYPLLHFLREASLERAIAHYPDTATIHETNRQKARTMGAEAMKILQGGFHSVT